MLDQTIDQHGKLPKRLSRVSQPNKRLILLFHTELCLKIRAKLTDITAPRFCERFGRGGASIVPRE